MQRRIGRRIAYVHAFTLTPDRGVILPEPDIVEGMEPAFDKRNVWHLDTIDQQNYFVL